MRNTTRTIITIEERLYSECLAFALRETGHFHVLEIDSQSVELTAAAQEIEKTKPHLCLVDLRLGEDWVCELMRASRRQANAKVILLTANRLDESLIGRIGLDADGWLLEQSSLSELKIAIDLVLRGKKYFSPQMVNLVFGHLGTLGFAADAADCSGATAQLTRRETEVLRLIAEENLTNKQIARRLSVSLYTVKNHVHHILEKLSVPSRYEAARYAFEQWSLPAQHGHL